MTEQEIMSRMENSVSEAFLDGQTSRRFWINGCQQTQSLTQMDMSAPVLMFPIIGRKTITVDRHVYDTEPGEILVLPKGLRFDLENIPVPGRTRFLGVSLVFDQQTIDLFSKVYADGMKDWHLTPKWKAVGSDDMFSLIADWLAHDRKYSSDMVQTRLRLVEILLILARQGVAGNLLISRSDTLAERITQHLLTDLSRDWSVTDLTRTLAMSESTLRRRLRSENTGFREVLEDARLNQGVERVMSSDMPIGQIAFDCGYQSQSRFAERFRMRFSMSPTELRATRKQQRGNLVSLDQHRPGH
ncbi:MAG: AraC family transcriptional regulator [Pseudomonadota bacterium]